MKIKEVLNTMVDIFYSANKSSRPAYQQSLIYFIKNIGQKQKEKILTLREINKTDEKKAKQFKSTELMCCTISAIFDSYRILSHIKELTGLIAIDIDKDKNPDLDVENAKQDISNLPYVALTMLSCRGEGIWCLIPYNKENNFKETWNSLKEDFLEKGYIIDDCKDETRLRFISWDDNILINTNDIEVYNKTKEISSTINKNKKEKHNDDRIVYTEDEWVLTKDNLKDITVAIYLLTHYCGYKSNTYNDWLLEGFRLATVPNREIGFKLFNWISEVSNNYKGETDVRNKFDECCNTSTYRTNILGYYINKIKEYYGPDWKIKANQLLKY